MDQERKDQICKEAATRLGIGINHSYFDNLFEGDLLQMEKENIEGRGKPLSEDAEKTLKYCHPDGCLDCQFSIGINCPK